MRQMVVLGYESHNCIVGLGSIAIFIFLYFLFAVIAAYLRVIARFVRRLRVFPFLKKILRSLMHQIYFKQLLDILLESILELLISIYLNLSVPLYSTSGEITANYFTYLILLFVVFFLPTAWFYYFL